jgi:iron complex transport system permease protein
VSGGAACGAAVSTALGLGRIPGVVPLVAFAGACGATAAVFLLARRRDHTDPTRLLLSGLVLNAFFSAVILIAFSLSKSSDLTAALRWMMGTLFGATWTSVMLVTSMLVAAMAVLAFLANDLRLLAFGEEDAKARGVNVERVKLIGFAAASIVTGAAVAVSGIIGFVGLLVPHLIRLIWRRDFRALLPLCALGGATLVAGADLLSRVIVPSAELPVGAFTAILGVPFFLSLLRRAR